MKKAPALLLALVVAAVRGEPTSKPTAEATSQATNHRCWDQYNSDDLQAACLSDSGCVWLDRWWRCLETCEGFDEDACDEADHCAFSDSSNTCSLSCEHEHFDEDYWSHDEDACAADSDCVWVAHSVLRL